ncbi:V-type ATP synthase subunit F [Halapricum desulfuricans]|uniref:A-type ATP synthase subunit F n=1 Tax=Halapricum desulfuricans TaxID=2841257 RepID=A0A897NTF1_9EURY|nr:V-type ATP synthase subunit F [Halapricum desulfuricans]QSG14063.1 Archaeal/vacuolar-type H+-ATPase subunit F [Halapricum desulfuricans]
MSKEIAVVGTPDFTTGFRLAGVRRAINIPDDEMEAELDETVKELLTSDDIGILVMHDDDLQYLSRGVRETVQQSVDPVLVTLGGGTESGNLREQIKRAIGIDLMEEDEQQL